MTVKHSSILKELAKQAGDRYHFYFKKQILTNNKNQASELFSWWFDISDQLDFSPKRERSVSQPFQVAL